MNISTSECSSGCESGWTMYLNQFSSSADQCNRSMTVDGEYNRRRRKGRYIYEHEEEEEEEQQQQQQQQDDEDEDLSMLSDASSGPPHFLQEEEQQQQWYEETRYSYNNVSSAQQKMKVKDQRRMQMQQNFHLDDTASSPVFSFPKASQKSIFHHKNNNVAFENGKSLMDNDSSYSATHYKGKSGLKTHFGFFKPSRTGKED